MRLFFLLAALLTASVAHAQDNIVLRNGEEIPAKVLEVNVTDLKYKKSANPDGPVYTAPLRDVLLIKYANGTKDVFGPNRAPAPGADAPRRGPSFSAVPQAPLAPGTERLRYNSRWLNRHFEGTAGQRLPAREVESLLQLQPAALAAFDRGRSLRTWSLVTAGTSVALVGAGVGVALSGEWGRGRDVRNGFDNDRFGRFRNGVGEGRGGDRNALVGASLAGGGVLLALTSVWLDHRATLRFRRAAERYTNRPATSLRFAPSRQGLGAGVTYTF
jgi:hypothetical protein